MENRTLKTFCIEEREDLKLIGKGIKEIADALKNQELMPVLKGEDRGEEIANMILAYRHIEDAAMRLGKVIQAFEGGISIYDKDMPDRDLNKEA